MTPPTAPVAPVHDDLDEALRRLTQQDRQMLDLVLVRGASLDEAAEQLGVTRSAAAARRRRVLQRLRRVLSDADPAKGPAEAEPSEGGLRSQPTVVLQARVSADFARELIDHDAKVLGLTSASEVVREALLLLHRHAQERAAAEAYAEFYGGDVAPLPAGVAPADAG